MAEFATSQTKTVVQTCIPKTRNSEFWGERFGETLFYSSRFAPNCSNGLVLAHCLLFGCTDAKSI